MKVNSLYSIKVPLITLGLTLTIPVFSQTEKFEVKKDTFEYVSYVPPQGTTSFGILQKAPSPDLTINGEIKTAKIVVDLSKNVLYKYDDNGLPEIAYLIASGKPSTPTDVGVRVVSGIEKYPYKTAHPTTKRHRNPNDYGPFALILRIVDTKTGETTPTGEFIHGNNNPKSIGTYASKGCMRMDNEVIKVLANQIKKGDFVIIK